ncbi:MFS transporter [Campylobacterota bacterium]|nr:MFS transporter [Campylobacterota bacterium]
MVMPLLAIYALELGGAPFLAGLAVGGYALMQMLFQYPFGALSDRFGRRTLIAVGMLIFAAGSIVCAFATDIYLLIAGRFVQGMGAVSSVITATIGDLTGEEKRSKAMALMGGSIAMSFVVALLVGPAIGGHFGVGSLFAISAILVIPALLILAFKVPTPQKARPIEPISGSRIRRVLQNRDLVRLNFAMFLHSFVMTSTFIFIPLTLRGEFGWAMTDFWKIYLPALFCGVGAMGVGAALGEKYNLVKAVMIGGILLLIATFGGVAWRHDESALLVWIVLIFVGINSLEPLMQSSATKFAKAAERGSALGLFNACQFFGVFVGGMSAGFLYGHFGLGVLAMLLCALCLVWLALTTGLNNPIKMGLLAIKRNEIRAEITPAMIENLEGVRECYTLGEADIVYIRFDPCLTANEKLSQMLIDYSQRKPNAD